MKPPPLPEPLRVLRDAWLSAVRAPRNRALVAFACLATTVALLVARMGTVSTRLVAGTILLLTTAVVLLERVLETRLFCDPARTIEALHYNFELD